VGLVSFSAHAQPVTALKLVTLSSNVTTGNTAPGAWRRIGNLLTVVGRLALTANSPSWSSTEGLYVKFLSQISSQLAMPLPFPTGSPVCNTGRVLDASTGVYCTVAAIPVFVTGGGSAAFPENGIYLVRTGNGVEAKYTTTSPMTWVTTDSIQCWNVQGLQIRW
jgi:hypothetical protein